MQYISFEGVGRFRVRKILKTLPYILAEVEPNIQDEPVESVDEAVELEREVYNALKFYIRLMQSYDPNKDLTISQAAKAVRPSLSGKTTYLDDNERRSLFSFALSNMIQMTQEKEAQLLLQTTSIIKRLSAQKDILLQACELVSEQLKEKINFTDDMKSSIRTLCYNSDVDNDILPADVVEAVAETEKDEWDIANIE